MEEEGRWDGQGRGKFAKTVQGEVSYPNRTIRTKNYSARLKPIQAQT
jgi:hypothetical protein